MAGITARRVVVALDCPDARELSEFYAAMLGRRIRDDAQYPNWVDVLPPERESNAVAINFQTVPHLCAPTWPDGSAPLEMDLKYTSSNRATAPLPTDSCSLHRGWRRTAGG